jgi:hypothetical protein
VHVAAVVDLEYVEPLADVILAGIALLDEVQQAIVDELLDQRVAGVLLEQ